MTAKTRQPLNLAPATQDTATPAILDARPLNTLLAALTDDLAFIKNFAPNSDACVTMERIRNRLDRAIREAGAGTLWMSVAEYALAEGVTNSAATYRCRTGKVAARKVGGRYLINASERRAA